jgi:DNA-binding NtrC family response regulator
MAVAKILWVDDEIESLQSQKLFLEHKGYEVHTLTNGFDAIEYVKDHVVDVVLIDETMPGITGLETLARIKELNSQVPVVLITKNETENLMDDAIGSQISDYLIKPVNPNQVLLSLKKIIDNKRLVGEKTTTAYQQQFRELFMALNSNPDYNEWMELYKNSCTGNWRWKKAIARKCAKYSRPRNRKPILSSANSFRRTMHPG